MVAMSGEGTLDTRATISVNAHCTCRYAGLESLWRTVDEMYEVRGVLSEVIVPEMVASCGSIDECLNEDGTVDEDKVAVTFGPLMKTLMEDPRARRLGGTPGAYAEIWAHKTAMRGIYGDGLKKLRDARPPDVVPASAVDATASMEHVLGTRFRV